MLNSLCLWQYRVSRSVLPLLRFKEISYIKGDLKWRLKKQLKQTQSQESFSLLSQLHITFYSVYAWKIFLWFRLCCRRDPYDCSTEDHTWSRVYYDGFWWDMDITNDISCTAGGKSLYGFRELTSAAASDQYYFVTKIYWNEYAKMPVTILVTGICFSHFSSILSNL